MCTSIVEVVRAHGAARSQRGWFAPTHAVIAYDHPQRALLEDAVMLDFVNHAEGTDARAAVELTLESARALHAALGRVIAAADAEEQGRHSGDQTRNSMPAPDMRLVASRRARVAAST